MAVVTSFELERQNNFHTQNFNKVDICCTVHRNKLRLKEKHLRFRHHQVKQYSHAHSCIFFSLAHLGTLCLITNFFRGFTMWDEVKSSQYWTSTKETELNGISTLLKWQFPATQAWNKGCKFSESESLSEQHTTICNPGSLKLSAIQLIARYCNVRLVSWCGQWSTPRSARLYSLCNRGLVVWCFAATCCSYGNNAPIQKIKW